MSSKQLFEYRVSGRNIVESLVFNKIDIISTVETRSIYEENSYCQNRNLDHKSQLKNAIINVKRLLFKDSLFKDEKEWVCFINNARVYLKKNRVLENIADDTLSVNK